MTAPTAPLSDPLAGALTDSPSRRGLLRHTGTFARPHRGLLGVAVGTGVLASLLVAATPLLAGWITDALLAGDPARALRWAAVGVALALVQVAAAAAGRSWLARAGEYLVRDVRDRVVDLLAATALRFVERHRTGELLQRSTAEIAALSAFVRDSLTELVVTTATVSLLLITLTIQSWQLAVVLVVVFLPASLFVMARFRAGAAAAFGAEAAAEADVQADFAEYARVRSLLITTGPRGRSAFRDAFADRNERAVAAAVRTVVLSRWIIGMSLVEGLSLVALVLAGAALVGADVISAGVVVAFVVGGQLLFTSFADLVNLVGAVEEAATGAARTGELLQVAAAAVPAAAAGFRDPAVSDRPDGSRDEGGRRPGDVDLTAVAFSYGHAPVLSGVTARFRAGRRYGIAGRTGSGKSTLGKVLAGLYPPTSGTVRVAGVDLTAVGPAQRAALVALVPQQVHLGPSTLADEVRLARPCATDAHLQAAAASLGLGGWVGGLPGGWHTVVATEHLLSTGERQLVAMLRVALLDSQVLVLDEITADIDRATAELVERCIDRLAGDRTVIVIAHRPETLARLDEVLEVVDGRLVPRPAAP